MIPNTKDRVLVSRGIEVSAEFGISKGDEAHLMTILRDTLYSDKILAVLREYSSNAWDAHREVGKGNVPIHVTLPTSMEPTLAIRDFGPGLSPDNVFNVYTQYGASTKRGTDNSVGMLGIGSKSGFAYSDSFTIVSFHGGKKRTYVAVLDATEKGLINLLDEEDCGDETGVLIQIAVRPEDIREFSERAQDLFKYFIPRPVINCDIPEIPEAQVTSTNGIIWSNYGVSERWVAVMGCVPYQIDTAQLRSGNDFDGVANFVYQLSGALFFNIGELQINASREGLKYSDSTRRVLVTKINAVIDEYVSKTLEGIRSGNLDPWQQRLRAQVLTRLKILVPKDDRDLLSDYVRLAGKIKSFEVHHHNSKLLRQMERTRELQDDKKADDEEIRNAKIRVHENSRLLIRDDPKRSLKGFCFREYDYLVRKNPGIESYDEVRKELEEAIEQSGMKGIPIGRTSELQWTRQNPGKIVDLKYRRRVFKYKDSFDGWIGRKKAEVWEAVKRTPTTEDVFVILRGFQTNHAGFDIFRKRRNDHRIVKEFGLDPLPPIYGYRTTDKKPLENKDCLGTPYLVWRRQFFKEALARPNVKKLFEDWLWYSIIDYSVRESPRVDKMSVQTVVKNLGKDHEITKLVVNHFRARKLFLKRRQSEWREPFEALLKYVNSLDEWPEVHAAFASICAQYPLINVNGNGIEDFWGGDAEKWADYVKLIDGARSWPKPHLSLLSPTIPSPSSGEENPTTSEKALLSSMP